MRFVILKCWVFDMFSSDFQVYGEKKRFFYYTFILGMNAYFGSLPIAIWHRNVLLLNNIVWSYI